MVLRRTTLILLVVLTVLVVGAVVGFIMFPERVKDALNGKTNTNTTTPTVTNTNSSTTPTNLSTPQDLNGDTPLTATLKFGTTELQFTSLDRLPTFDQIAAPEGQQYVVLYFEGIASAATAMVFDSLASAQLVDGAKRYTPEKLKVATDVVKNDRGYIVFITPSTAGKLMMEVGSGAEAQSVVLP